MSRRHIFTERQRAALFDLPTDELSLLKFYTLGDDDLENIRQRRRPENRIGFALQLCALRYPGRALAPGEMIPREVLSFVGAQLGVPADALLTYATRRQTRQQHMDTLREIYGYKTFTGRGARDLREWTFGQAEDARSNEDLAHRFIVRCRETSTILPAVSTIERLCADALVAAERRIETRIAEYFRFDNACTNREGIRMALTDIKVRAAKPTDKQYKLTDGGGMHLLVHPNGSKYWRLQYRYEGKQKMLALGVYPEITLADARVRRDEARKLLANGVDPGDKKKNDKVEQSKARTFKEVAIEWHGTNKKWSEDHAHRVLKSLEDNLFAALGERNIAELKTRDLLAPIVPLTIRNGQRFTEHNTNSRRASQLRWSRWCVRQKITTNTRIAALTRK